MPFQITAQPTRIAAGGIVVLQVEPPRAGVFEAEWSVEGPVRITGHDANIALLGTTTLPGRLLTFTADDKQNLTCTQATLDTASLIAGVWRV
jgi:hypothetical protein